MWKSNFPPIIWFNINIKHKDHKTTICVLCVNTLKPKQNGRCFPDDIFKYIFLNEDVGISLKISLKFIPKVRINNIPAPVQIMAWRRSGDNIDPVHGTLYMAYTLFDLDNEWNVSYKCYTVYLIILRWTKYMDNHMSAVNSLWIMMHRDEPSYVSSQVIISIYWRSSTERSTVTADKFYKDAIHKPSIVYEMMPCGNRARRSSLQIIPCVLNLQILLCWRKSYYT